MKRRQFLKSSLSSQAVMLAATATAATKTAAGRSQTVVANKNNESCSIPSEKNLNDRQLDSLVFTQSIYAETAPSLAFTAADKRSALLWQRQSRKALSDLLGLSSERRVALRPQILERKEFAAYTRERIIFQSRKNLSVVGYLLLPRKTAGPRPGIVCLPGHGRGADDIVGIEADGKQRETKNGYQMDFAVQAAERGYAALAIEQLAFGCRRDAPARRKGAEQSSCQPAAGAALLFGQTMIGWRVWDVMRAIDYLSARPEIDRQRIATMGISGGGTASFFSAALDRRIKACVVSGYFNTFRESILSISHCIDNYVPGILNYFEMYDIAGLIAPRPFFVESGTRDNIFPIEASKLAFREARRIYTAFGAQEKINQEVFEGRHQFHGVGAFAFLERWL